MCELFALSAKYPTKIQLSLDTFALRGGGTGPHKDGWGAAFYQGVDAWIIRDAHSAAQSPWKQLLQHEAPESHMVLSHIRLATQGDVRHSNTQPFSFPMKGRRIVFSHNGHVPGILVQTHEQKFQPIGTTDSEAVFTALLSLLDEHWDQTEVDRFVHIERFLQTIAELGPLNIQFSDGESLFAFSNKRTQKDKKVCAPGMHFLCRHCSKKTELHKSNVEIEGPDQHLIMFASVPLTDEDWQPMTPNKLYVARQGVFIKQ